MDNTLFNLEIDFLMMVDYIEENDFHYLIPLDVPQKLTISHKIIQKLLDVSTGKDHKITHSKNSLKPNQLDLFNYVERFANKEQAFKIAKDEYSLKIKRFLLLTKTDEQALEETYTKESLGLKEIDTENLLFYIDQRKLNDINKIMVRNLEIIEYDINTLHKRVDYLKKKWMEISQELLSKIQNYSQRGLKMASNNLRVRALPQVEEMKIALKQEMTDSATSRFDLQEQFNDLITKTEDDIFGDLTNNQKLLYDRIIDTTSNKEIISIIEADNTRADLIELINTDKIKINLIKLIDSIV